MYTFYVLFSASAASYSNIIWFYIPLYFSFLQHNLNGLVLAYCDIQPQFWKTWDDV